MEHYREKLETMNRGKLGRPYSLSRTYTQFLAAVRYPYGMPYRQLEGFTRRLHKLVPQLPDGVTPDSVEPRPRPRLLQAAEGDR
ncbi:MAG: hypothetical protein DRI26_00635 [Chloroflexi bacterium]|nr:MAG: hypothetical protein DRI26_00635 [Chloroflexota bacterium]